MNGTAQFVCSVQCAVCSAVCSVQCAVCSVQCAVCSVQCAVCSGHRWSRECSLDKAPCFPCAPVHRTSTAEAAAGGGEILYCVSSDTSSTSFHCHTGHMERKINLNFTLTDQTRPDQPDQQSSRMTNLPARDDPSTGGGFYLRTEKGVAGMGCV